MTMGDYWLSTERLKFLLVALVLIVYFGVLTAQENNEGAEVSCPPNEVYRPCLVDCMNCDFRGYCALDCNRTGCDCISNFYRLEPDGPCEPVAKCPQFECGENEVFRDCGPVCERCNTMLCRIVTCERRCYCKEGYLRNINWTCVPADQCPEKTMCTDTEDMAKTGKIQEYCLYADSETVTNDTQEKLDCYCKEGYKRNGLGYCVEEKYCPYVHCVDTEVYMACPPNCNTTCRNYGDPECKEDGQCYPGCFCKEGMVMNDWRNCIPLEECPPDSSPYLPTASPRSDEETTEASDESTTAAPPPTTEEAAETEATTEEEEITTETEETTAAEAETTVPEEEETTQPPPPKAKKPQEATKASLKSKLSKKALAAAAAKAAAAAEE